MQVPAPGGMGLSIPQLSEAGTITSTLPISHSTSMSSGIGQDASVAIQSLAIPQYQGFGPQPLPYGPQYTTFTMDQKLIGLWTVAQVQHHYAQNVELLAFLVNSPNPDVPNDVRAAIALLKQTVGRLPLCMSNRVLP
jgi:hypothetical protein